LLKRREPIGAIRPIVINDRGIPDWPNAGEVRADGAPFRAPDADAQVGAVRGKESG